MIVIMMYVSARHNAFRLYLTGRQEVYYRQHVGRESLNLFRITPSRQLKQPEVPPRRDWLWGGR